VKDKRTSETDLTGIKRRKYPILSLLPLHFRDERGLHTSTVRTGITCLSLIYGEHSK